MQRDYRADNIRFLLIFLVVFAHLLEYISGDTADTLYRLIYTFHMGVFVFLTGCFASYKPRKILLSLVWPYFLFQTLYKVFYGYVIQEAETVALTYTTPYWLLWYLMAVVFYYLLIPMLQQKELWGRLLAFGTAVAASLLAGLDETVGYYLTLSRFLCYMPFFVAGYYAGHGAQLRPKQVGRGAKAVLLSLCVMFLILAESYVLGNPGVFRRNVLYGSYSYVKETYAWTDRALLQLIAFAWTGLLFLVTPKRKLPVISVIGGNTMPVFLFHGFLIRLIGKWKIFQYAEGANLWLALGITVGMVLLFGNPVSAWICKWIFTGHWITALSDKREKARP